MESDWARANELEKKLRQCEKNIDTCGNVATWLLFLLVGSNLLWFFFAVLPHLRWE